METLEPSQGLPSIGLVACITYLTATNDTSLVVERPTFSWAAILSVCSVVFLLFDKIQLLCSRVSRREQTYTAIPLEDLHSRDGALSPPLSERPLSAQSRSKTSLWLHRGILALVLVSRIEVFRHTGAKTGVASLEAAVPAFIAIAGWLQTLLPQQRPQSRGHSRGYSIDGASNTSIAKALAKYALSPLVYAAIFSWFGALAISYAPSSLTSSYISRQRHLESFPQTTPLQILGAALDVVIGIYLSMSLKPVSKPQFREKNEPVFSIGVSCIIAAASHLALSLVIHLWRSSHGPNHSFYETENFPSRILKIAVVIGLAAYLALRTALHSSVLDTSLLTLCTVASVSFIAKTWKPSTPFLDAHEFKALIPLGLLIGVLIHSVAALAGEKSADDLHKPDPPRRRWSVFHLLGALFAFLTFVAYGGRSELQTHRVESLMGDARKNHDSWLKKASSSTSLDEATQTYIARYNQKPPPQFDQWYEFATNRSATVIDEFDSIHEDLLPFWSLSPSEIRRRTREAFIAPTGGIGGIHIRDGIATVSGNTPGTHMWSINGIIDMIDKFGKFLPDMDIAINLNDECRVSLPYRELQSSQEAARIAASNTKKTGSDAVNEFSPERASGWEQDDAQLNSDRFIVLSFQNTWDFSSAHCPPDSPARTTRHWDPEIFCASCAAPHSSDLFMANWTLAADVCHQPDLAHLHGFYISPSAFDATPHLMPIFSQSKAGGFNDIRFPSPWDYMDKAKYEPNEDFPDDMFEVKNDALFWRGATSEGFSKAGTGAWRGMARQRFVNLASSPPAAQPLLLPDPTKADEKNLHLRYALFESGSLHESIPTDTHFTEIVRCDSPDCDDEVAQFGLGSRTDFQQHWSYKYLLDADGAGFSGRFRPFLLSNSLPFKVALFREWWDGRVAPWVHFVPLDLRGQGLWATLAYFKGFEGTIDGEDVKWPPRYIQAKGIADEGASWARKVLRKEDMEIYMFRLLLEWGRLTDDRRSEIGFSAP